MRGSVARVLTLWVHKAAGTGWWRTPNTLAHHGYQGCSGPGTRPKGTHTRARARAESVYSRRGVRPLVPNPESEGCEACSGPTSMWPRSLCPQGALDGSVRQPGALKIGRFLGATFGLQDPASLRNPLGALFPGGTASGAELEGAWRRTGRARSAARSAEGAVGCRAVPLSVRAVLASPGSGRSRRPTPNPARSS